MGTIDLTKLTGSELFEYYTSRNDEYASNLLTAYAQIKEGIFNMLEEAQKKGKRIAIDEEIPGVIDSPLTITIE